MYYIYMYIYIYIYIYIYVYIYIYIVIYSILTVSFLEHLNVQFPAVRFCSSSLKEIVIIDISKKHKKLCNRTEDYSSE